MQISFYIIFFLEIFQLTDLDRALLLSFASAEKFSGGTSVSGFSVKCYENMSICVQNCRFTCYTVDHCNDSPNAMVACAPELFL